MNLELCLQGVLDDSGSHVRLATCFQSYTLCLGNVGYLGLQCRHWRMCALKLWRGVAKELASGGLDEASCKALHSAVLCPHYSPYQNEALFLSTQGTEDFREANPGLTG